MVKVPIVAVFVAGRSIFLSMVVGFQESGYGGGEEVASDHT